MQSSSSSRMRDINHNIMQLNYMTNAHYGQFKTIQINKHPGWDGSSRPHYAWHRG